MIFTIDTNSPFRVAARMYAMLPATSATTKIGALLAFGLGYFAPRAIDAARAERQAQKSYLAALQAKLDSSEHLTRLMIDNMYIMMQKRKNPIVAAVAISIFYGSLACMYIASKACNIILACLSVANTAFNKLYSAIYSEEKEEIKEGPVEEATQGMLLIAKNLKNDAYDAVVNSNTKTKIATAAGVYFAYKLANNSLFGAIKDVVTVVPRSVAAFANVLRLS